MAEIIQFPSNMYGKQIALLTESKMYIGELCKPDNILGVPIIQLNRAVVAPINSHPKEGEVINLLSVHVRWDKVVAFAPADHFQINYFQSSAGEERV